MSTSTAAALAVTDHLTPFDGKPVLRTTISVTNAGDGLSEAMAIDPRELHHGEVVHVVLECEVAKVRFDPIKDAPDHLTRVHQLRAGTATIVDAAMVQDVLDRQRLAIEKAKEAAAGIARLPGTEPWDAEADALAAEHLDGQHAAGLREGCEYERQAEQDEASDG